MPNANIAIAFHVNENYP